MEQLANEVLTLIRQMYYVERNMLFIGLTDVINLTEQNLTEFIVLATNATHLSTPLNFLTYVTKLTEVKNIPYIYACTKEQLGRACCITTGISVIAIKIGPSYFLENIKNIKHTIRDIMDIASTSSNITI